MAEELNSLYQTYSKNGGIGTLEEFEQAKSELGDENFNSFVSDFVPELKKKDNPNPITASTELTPLPNPIPQNEFNVPLGSEADLSLESASTEQPISTELPLTPMVSSGVENTNITLPIVPEPALTNVGVPVLPVVEKPKTTLEILAGKSNDIESEINPTQEVLDADNNSVEANQVKVSSDKSDKDYIDKYINKDYVNTDIAITKQPFNQWGKAQNDESGDDLLLLEDKGLIQIQRDQEGSPVFEDNNYVYKITDKDYYDKTYSPYIDKLQQDYKSKAQEENIDSARFNQGNVNNNPEQDSYGEFITDLSKFGVLLTNEEAENATTYQQRQELLATAEATQNAKKNGTTFQQEYDKVIPKYALTEQVKIANGFEALNLLNGGLQSGDTKDKSESDFFTNYFADKNNVMQFGEYWNNEGKAKYQSSQVMENQANYQAHRSKIWNDYLSYQNDKLGTDMRFIEQAIVNASSRADKYTLSGDLVSAQNEIAKVETLSSQYDVNEKDRNAVSNLFTESNKNFTELQKQKEQEANLKLKVENGDLLSNVGNMLGQIPLGIATSVGSTITGAGRILSSVIPSDNLKDALDIMSNTDLRVGNVKVASLSDKVVDFVGSDGSKYRQINGTTYGVKTDGSLFATKYNRGQNDKVTKESVDYNWGSGLAFVTSKMMTDIVITSAVGGGINKGIASVSSRIANSKNIATVFGEGSQLAKSAESFARLAKNADNVSVSGWYVQMYNDSYQMAEKGGIKGELNKSLYAITQSFMQSVIQRINPDINFLKSMNNESRQIVRALMTNEKDKAVQLVSAFIKKTGNNVLKETGEEVIQQVTQDLNNLVINKIGNTNLATTDKQGYKEVVFGTVIPSAIASLMGGKGSRIANINNKEIDLTTYSRNDLVTELTRDKNGLDLIKDFRNTAYFQSQKDFAQDIVNEINERQKYISKVPESEKYSTTALSEVSPILQKIDEKKELLKNDDGTFSGRINNDITALTEQANAILDNDLNINNAETTQSTPQSEGVQNEASKTTIDLNAKTGNTLYQTESTNLNNNGQTTLQEQSAETEMRENGQSVQEEGGDPNVELREVPQSNQESEQVTQANQEKIDNLNTQREEELKNYSFDGDLLGEEKINAKYDAEILKLNTNETQEQTTLEQTNPSTLTPFGSETDANITDNQIAEDQTTQDQEVNEDDIVLADDTLDLINSLTDETVQSDNFGTDGSVESTPEIVQQQGENNGTETTTQSTTSEAKVEVESFPTANGKYTIRKSGNSFELINNKTKKPAKVTDETKDVYLLEVAKNREYTPTEIPQGVNNQNDYEGFIISESNNPKEVAEVLLSMPKYANVNGTRDSFIANNIDRVDRGSFVRFSDENNITIGLAQAYFAKKGSEKNNHKIDIIAQNASLEMSGGQDGDLITPDEVVEFMLGNRKGAESYFRQPNPEYQSAVNKFFELTGVNPTPKSLNSILDNSYNEQLEVKSKEEAEKRYDAISDEARNNLANEYSEYFNSLTLEDQQLELQKTYPNETITEINNESQPTNTEGQSGENVANQVSTETSEEGVGNSQAELRTPIKSKNHQLFYNGKVVDMGYVPNAKEQFKYAGMRVSDNNASEGFIKTPKGEIFRVSKDSKTAKKLSGSDFETANTNFQEAVAFQSTDKQFTPITQKAYNALVNKLSGVFKRFGGNVVTNLSEFKAKAKALGLNASEIDLMVRAFHGSPHSFDRFTTDKMGTGEGVQAFGWGLYFTDIKSIAENYAKVLSGKDYSIVLDELKINGKVISDKSILNLFKDAIESFTNPYNTVSTSLAGVIEDESIANKIESGEYKVEYKITPSKSKNLYEVSLHNGKTPEQYSWLEWDKPLSENNRNKITQQAKKEGIDVSNLFGFGNDINSKTVYDNLSFSEFNDNPKEASLFLLRAGIDGVKYPAESISRGTTSDNARGFNYVVFDENAITIDNKVQFMKTNGEIYGAKLPDGTIYLNPDKVNANTPIHEFSHLWQQLMPTRFKSGVEILKNTPIGKKTFAELKANEGYANKTDEEIWNEALVTVMGNEGERIFNSPKTSKIKTWLTDFFKKLGDVVGIRKLTPTDNISVFVKGALSEVMGDKEIFAEGATNVNNNIDFQIPKFAKPTNLMPKSLIANISNAIRNGGNFNDAMSVAKESNWYKNLGESAKNNFDLNALKQTVVDSSNYYKESAEIKVAETKEKIKENLKSIYKEKVAKLKERFKNKIDKIEANKESELIKENAIKDLIETTFNTGISFLKENQIEGYVNNSEVLGLVKSFNDLNSKSDKNKALNNLFDKIEVIAERASNRSIEEQRKLQDTKDKAKEKLQVAKAKIETIKSENKDKILKLKDKYKERIETLKGENKELRVKQAERKAIVKETVYQLKSLLVGNNLDGRVTPTEISRLIKLASDIGASSKPATALNTFFEEYAKIQEKAEARLEVAKNKELTRDEYEQLKTIVQDMVDGGIGIDAIKDSVRALNLPFSKANFISKEVLLKINEIVSRYQTDKLTPEQSTELLATAYDQSKDGKNETTDERTKLKKASDYLKTGFVNFVEKYSDRQFRAKEALRKIGALNTYNRLINSAGSSAKANETHSKIYEKVFKGLDNDARVKLNQIIVARRIIAIEENREKRGLSPINHSNNITYDSAKKALQQFETENKTQYDDLLARSKDYFKAFNEQLDAMLKGGLITQQAYDGMNGIDYQPRMFLQHIADYQGNVEEGIGGANYNTSKKAVGSTVIQTLDEGSIGKMVMDADWILRVAIASNTKMSAMNEVNRVFITKELPKARADYDLLKQIDESKRTPEQKQFIRYFENLSEQVKDNPIVGYTAQGNPKFKIETPPQGFTKNYYYIDGVRNEFFLSDDLHNNWNDIYEKNITKSIEGNVVSKVVLTYPTKFTKLMATGINPLFFIVNTPRDFFQVINFSDAYSNNVLKATKDLALDTFKAYKDTYKRDKGAENTMYEKYIEYGGGMDFLATQGKFDKKYADKNKILGALDTINTLSKYSEIGFRIATFSRSNQNGLKAYNKENNTNYKSVEEIPNQYDKDNIYHNSVRTARAVMDFNQGGKTTKDLDSMLPYLNASVQGTRSMVDALRKRPYQTASKMMQTATYMTGLVFGLMASAFSLFDDDEDEKGSMEKIIDAYDRITPTQRANSWNIVLPNSIAEKLGFVLPEKKAIGEYYVLKIAKTQALAPLLYVMEEGFLNIAKSSLGRQERSYFDIGKASTDIANKNLLPFELAYPTAMFKSLIGKTFAGKAFIANEYGYDTYRGEKLSADIDQVPRGAEGLANPNVEDFYKDFGKVSGYSPVRTKAMVEGLITSPQTNPYVMATYGALNVATNIMSKEDRQIVSGRMKDDIKRMATGRLFSQTSQYAKSLSTSTKANKNKFEEVDYAYAKRNAMVKDLSTGLANGTITVKYAEGKVLELKLTENETKNMFDKISERIENKDVDPELFSIKYDKSSAEGKALRLVEAYPTIDLRTTTKEANSINAQLDKIGGIATKDVISYYVKIMAEKDKLKK